MGTESLWQAVGALSRVTVEVVRRAGMKVGSEGGGLQQIRASSRLAGAEGGGDESALGQVRASPGLLPRWRGVGRGFGGGLLRGRDRSWVFCRSQ